jgi:acetyl-CoA carboxylase biotin carboxyl carrier protein
LAEDRLIPVRAQISGIFYRSPAPDQPSFVEIGQKVKKGQTLCLLETMKLFTKVKAPQDGEVAEVLVENEHTISKSQVLFNLKP